MSPTEELAEETPTGEVQTLPEEQFAEPAPVEAPAATAEAPTTPIEQFADPESDQESFDAWYAETAQANGLNPDPNDPRHQYDWRAYWEENIKGKPEMAHFHGTTMKEHGGQRRFPDKYKQEGYDTAARDAEVERNQRFTITPEEAQFLAPEISHGEDPDLENVLDALRMQESGGNPRAVSPAGALGAYQIMPSMWRKRGRGDPFNEDDSRAAASRIYSEEYIRFSGNRDLALAAYNAGSPKVIEALSKAGIALRDAGGVAFETIAPYLKKETQDYVPSMRTRMSGIPQKKNLDYRYAPGPKDAGTVGELKALLEPIVSSSDYNQEDALTSIKKLQAAYATKAQWTPDAQSLMKDVASTVWDAATPNEMPDLGGLIGTPPELAATDKKPKETLAKWKTSTTDDLRRMGMDPVMLGKRYDEYFEEAQQAEQDAFAYRQRGVIGDAFHWLRNTEREVVQGGVGAVTSAVSLAPRLLGYEETAQAIDKVPSWFAKTPTNEYLYEVDEKGYVKKDIYGNPITKFQGQVASAFGMLGTFLGGGWAAKSLGVGAKILSGIETGTITASIANSAYQSAIENGGDRSQAILSAIYSLPAGAIGSLTNKLLLAGGPAWVRGLSPFNKVKAIAKLAAGGAATGTASGAAMMLAQDIGTSAALGKSVIDPAKELETAAGFGLAGGVFRAAEAPLRPNAAEHARIAQDLETFAKSDAVEGKIDLKSPVDWDPQLADIFGINAQVTPDGSKVAVQKTHTYVPPDIAAIPPEELPNHIKTLKESIDKDQEATLENAQDLQAKVNKANEDLKNIPEQAKSEIPTVREIEFEKARLEAEVKLLKEEAKGVPDEQKAEYEEAVKEREERLAIVDKYLSSDEAPVRAARAQKEKDDAYTAAKKMAGPTYENDRQLKQRTLQAMEELQAAASEMEDPEAKKMKPPRDVYGFTGKPNIPYTSDFTAGEVIPQDSKTPVNPRDILKAARKVMNTMAKWSPDPAVANRNKTSIREGGRPSVRRKKAKNWLGYFTPSKRYVWVRHSNDVATIMHETTHAMEADLIDIHSLPMKVKIGLVHQAIWTYGSMAEVLADLNKGMKEGLAMFMEHYTSGQPVHKDVLEWYQNEFKAQNPKAYEAFESFKKQIKGYIAMDPLTRATVFMGAKPPGKPPKYFLDEWVDSKQAIADFDKLAGTGLRATMEAYQGQAREVSHNWVNGKGELKDFENHPVAGVVSIRDYVEPVRKRKELNLLSAYLLARYTVARAGMKGLPAREQATGFPPREAEKLINQIENERETSGPRKGSKKWEHIQKAAEGIWRWNDALLDMAASRSSLYAVIRRNIRQDNLKYTKSTHGYYIPFRREWEPIADLARGTYKFGEADAIKRFKGGGQRIINPLTFLEDHARLLLERANQNYFREQMHAQANLSASPVASLIRRIPRESEAKLKVSIDEALKEISGVIGMDIDTILRLDQDTKETMLTFWRPEMTPPRPSDGYVTMAYKAPNGGIEFYEEHPRLVQAMDNSLPDLTRNSMVNALWIKPNQFFKLGATAFRMAYQLRNLAFRDFATAYRRVDTLNPFQLFQEVVRALGSEALGVLNPKWLSPWSVMIRNLGGLSGTLHHAGREFELDLEAASGRKVLGLGGKTFDWMENVLSVGERANRLAAMKLKARELGITDPTKPLTPQQAIELLLTYKRSTTNFQIQGRTARVWNMGVPFFTARIAELTQLRTDWAQHRGKMYAYGLGFLTLGIYTALANKDEKWWQNIEPEEKASNFLTRIGDKIYRIPLETLAGVFNGLGSLIGESIVRQDLVKPEVAEQVFGMAKAYAPISSWADLLGVLPKEAIQQIANKDFYTKRDIVPRGLIEAPISQQFTAATTELAKEIGRRIGIAPARIDHAFRGVFPAGLDFLRMVEVQGGVKPISEVPPGFGSLFATAVTRYGYAQSSLDRTQNQFYQGVAKFQARKDIETIEEGTVRKQLNRIRIIVGDINVVLSAEPDEDLRKDLYEKKSYFLDKGLALLHGEQATVEAAPESGRAKQIREQRRMERAQRLRVLEGTQVSDTE